MTKDICIVHTDHENFDMKKIKKRRFMYNPKSGTLIIGQDTEIAKSHAEEYGTTATTEPIDYFVRGWIGNGKGYPHGVIHFAPNIPKECAWLYEKGSDTLDMFKENGATKDCLIRGFGRVWEQPMKDIIS